MAMNTDRLFAKAHIARPCIIAPQSSKSALIALLLVLCLTLAAACAKDKTDDADGNVPETGGTPQSSNDNDATAGDYDEMFDRLCDRLFIEWVTSDAVTLNFFLANPEEMGIEHPGATFGKVMSPELFEEERRQTQDIKDELGKIEYNLLTGERQLIYDTMSRAVLLSEIMEHKDSYAYYTGYIRPVTGMQVQLPVLLAEYNFRTKEDIELYLMLLEDAVRYFDEIIVFELERAALGYFLNEANLNEVIAQLESFTEDRENNMLITAVNSKIDSFPGLSAAEREQYKEKNRTLVLSSVLAAYGNLLDAMRSLSGSAVSTGAIAAFPDGEVFAHAMLSLEAGTDIAPGELLQTVYDRKNAALSRIRQILASDSQLNRRYNTGAAGEIAYDSPENYLETLRSAIEKDFPPAGETNTTVMEVHESMRDFMSPAFYLMPALDSYSENVIYINPAGFSDSGTDNLSLFTVLAHEGYPGHLYSTVLFRQMTPHPIRVMLSGTGYTEGWATYAEQYSYALAGLPGPEAELMAGLKLYFLLLQSYIDLGVNLFNWDTDDVLSVLNEDLGVTDTDTALAYYNSVTGAVFNISMYALGFIEIENLRALAENLWAEDFSLYRFHEFILSTGPAPFLMIRDRLYG